MLDFRFVSINRPARVLIFDITHSSLASINHFRIYFQSLAQLNNCIALHN